jgi:hypothetical protein
MPDAAWLRRRRAEINGEGERLIWLAPKVVNRLCALRGPGVSYNDVILRLANDGNW